MTTGSHLWACPGPATEEGSLSPRLLSTAALSLVGLIVHSVPLDHACGLHTCLGFLACQIYKDGAFGGHLLTQSPGHHPSLPLKAAARAQWRPQQ